MTRTVKNNASLNIIRRIIPSVPATRLLNKSHLLRVSVHVLDIFFAWSTSMVTSGAKLGFLTSLDGVMINFPLFLNTLT